MAKIKDASPITITTRAQHDTRRRGISTMTSADVTISLIPHFYLLQTDSQYWAYDTSSKYDSSTVYGITEILID